MRRTGRNSDLTPDELRWLVFGHAVDQAKALLMDNYDVKPLVVAGNLGDLAREFGDAAGWRGLDDEATRQASLALLDALAVLQAAP